MLTMLLPWLLAEGVGAGNRQQRGHLTQSVECVKQVTVA